MQNNYISDSALILCKDRTILKVPGKYDKRPKALRPAAKAAHGHCQKKSFRSIDQVKRAVAGAEFARKRADQEGGRTRRREIRWFECFNHEVKMYHLTSVELEVYAARFEAGRRGEFAHVA